MIFTEKLNHEEEKKDKSRHLFKFVSVLLSASVERVGVSRMRDFFPLLLFVLDFFVFFPLLFFVFIFS